jgi:hypothetical protein
MNKEANVIRWMGGLMPHSQRRRGEGCPGGDAAYETVCDHCRAGHNATHQQEE